MTTADWLQFATLIVSAAVGAIVYWYTKETQKLRKLAEKQIQVSNMPIVVLQMISEERGLAQPLRLRPVAVRNVGRGTAFNVVVSPLAKAPFEVQFETIPLLEPSETLVLQFTIRQNAQSGGFSRMTVYLDSVIENFGPESVVKITYSDSSGRLYSSLHIVRVDTVAGEVRTVFQNQREESPGKTT